MIKQIKDKGGLGRVAMAEKRETRLKLLHEYKKLL